MTGKLPSRTAGRRFINPRRRRDLLSFPGANCVTNPLPISVALYWAWQETITPNEPMTYDSTVPPNTTASTNNCPTEGVLVAMVDATGAYVSYSGNMSTGYILGVQEPNTLAVPSASAGPVPADVPPVLVGVGLDTQNNLVTREQFWTRSPQSYSVAPNEVRTVSITEVSGINSSSSSLETIANALNVSASAGFGPVSASLSTSLSVSFTSQQQVTVTDQTTSSSVIQLSGGANGLVVIYWQLMDRIIWWKPSAVISLEVLTIFQALETAAGFNTPPATPVTQPAGNMPVAALILGNLPLVPVPWSAQPAAASLALGTAAQRRDKNRK